MTRTSLSMTVVLLFLAGCGGSAPKFLKRVNSEASLPGNLPDNPLGWRVISCGADPAESTMSTLFGNETAVQHARTNLEGNYPPGSVLSLVTWHQRDDPEWFGARMPAAVKRIEFVSVESLDGHPSRTYRSFEGAPLQETPNEPIQAAARATYLVSLRAAVMP